jgi:hypothetical protein
MLPVRRQAIVHERLEHDSALRNGAMVELVPVLDHLVEPPPGEAEPLRQGFPARDGLLFRDAHAASQALFAKARHQSSQGMSAQASI